MNNFLYPSFVQLLSESVVAAGNENTVLPILQWKQLCASRQGAILEFLVISRHLLQLEITSSSLRKQMFHTVENTQTKENCRLDSVFSNTSCIKTTLHSFSCVSCSMRVQTGYSVPDCSVVFVCFTNRPVQRFCFPLLSPCGSRSYANEVDQVSMIVFFRN